MKNNKLEDMKELERTKRISISAVLFLVVIIIAVLTFRKPQFVFHKDSATTLEKIVTKDYILTLNDMDTIDSSQYAIIDIRSNYEYEKGHIEDAVNIYTHEVFNEGSIKFLDQLKDDGKIAILYAAHPDVANSAWMLLYQMGYENIKILCVETDYVNKTFHIKYSPLEKPYLNFAQVMDSAKSDQPAIIKKEKPKKRRLFWKREEEEKSSLF